MGLYERFGQRWIRTGKSSDFRYQGDYDDLRALADFADANGVCVLVCHHCRKSRSDESPFLDISGTTGLTGAVAGMIVLRPDGRGRGATVMSVAGKDVGRADYRLELSGCRWRLLERISHEEERSCPVPECVMAAADFVNARRSPWRGSAAELMEAVGVTGMPPETFGKHLAQHRSYMARAGVAYLNRHTRTGDGLRAEVSAAAAEVAGCARTLTELATRGVDAGVEAWRSLSTSL